MASSAISFTESVIAPAAPCITIEGAVTEGLVFRDGLLFEPACQWLISRVIRSEFRAEADQKRREQDRTTHPVHHTASRQRPGAVHLSKHRGEHNPQTQRERPDREKCERRRESHSIEKMEGNREPSLIDYGGFLRSLYYVRCIVTI